MEEKKTRKVIKADGTVTEEPIKKPAAKTAKATQAKPAPEAVPEGNAKGLRIGAFVLWFVGIALEVVAIMILTKKIYVNNLTLWLIITLAADFVAVIIANLLWKKSNRIKPVSEQQKIKFFLHNNLGLMMSIIAFVPVIIVLLKDKQNLNEKTKKFVAIGLIIALAICALVGIDFNPVSQESKAAQLAEAEALSIDTVYWTTFGQKYHYDSECQHIRDKNIYSGSVEQAIQANRTELCKTCEANFEASVVDAATEAVTEAVAEEPIAEVAEQAEEVAPAA